MAQSASFAAPATLAPVIVSATRFADDANKLAFGVSIITAEQIRQSGAATVNEAVMKLLGVPGRVDLNGGGDYNLDLRGFGSTSDSNQVVIVDGIKMNEGDLGGTRLSGIPIDTVERIEIIRGSGTVLYGEGATGGVIVIATKGRRGVARKNQGYVSGAVGTHDLFDARGGATVVAGDFSLDVSSNTRTSDNHRVNFKSTTDGAAATGQWRNDWLRIGTTQAYDKLDTGLPGSLTAAQYAADPRQASSLTDSGHIRNRRSIVFAEAELGDWQLGLDAGWRDKLSRSTTFDYDVDARNYSVRARHSKTFGSAKNAVIFGFDSGEWDREVFGSFGSVANQTNRAFYVKDDVTLPFQTRVSVGFRSERVKKQSTDSNAVNIDDTQQAWELGVTQPVTAAASVYGRVGRSFRLANADEFTFSQPGGLRPQISRDVELGGRWAGAGQRAELRVYRSALTDEIGFDPTATGPFGPFGANINYADPTRRQGVELEWSANINAAIDVRAVAARRQSRFESGPNAGKQVPLAPKTTLALGSGWKPVEGHRLDAIVNWVSSQHPDMANECTMPNYTTVDFRYAFQRDNLELAFGMKNVAGRKYYTQAFRCIGGETSAIYPEDGRAMNVSVRVSF